MRAPRGVLLVEARTPKEPRTMSASEINKELDKLDALDRKLTDEFIATGRGYEKPSETRQMTDPLAMRARAVWDRRMKLQIEVELRYGPRAPSRLPLKRGWYGPRKESVDEADVRLRELERKAAGGDTGAAIQLGRELERVGRPTYEYWSGLLRRSPRSIPLRVMWLNAAQREDKPAYVYSTTLEETWFNYQYFIQTSRDDGIEEEELGPYGSEYEADQAGRRWWAEMRRHDEDDEFVYDYEVIDRSSEEPEVEHSEIVDDEEATLEELLYELEQRGMYGSGDDGRWYSDHDTNHRTGREEGYYIHVKYLIPYAPHDMLQADSERIADALKRRITDAERVPMLDPGKVRR